MNKILPSVLLICFIIMTNGQCPDFECTMPVSMEECNQVGGTFHPQSNDPLCCCDVCIISREIGSSCNGTYTCRSQGIVAVCNPGSMCIRQRGETEGICR